MFVTQEPKTIEDFFKDIKFLVPQGFNLDYFVLPTTETEEVKQAVPIESYNAESIKTDNHTGTTVVYTKKDMTNAQSFSDSVPEDPIATAPAPMPRHVQGQPSERMQGDLILSGGQLVSPMPPQARVVESLKESGGTRMAIVLRESVGRLPKNTLLYFTKEGA